MTLFWIVLDKPNSPRVPLIAFQFTEDWLESPEVIGQLYKVQRQLSKRLESKGMCEVSLSGDSIGQLRRDVPETDDYLKELRQPPLPVRVSDLSNSSPDELAERLFNTITKSQDVDISQVSNQPIPSSNTMHRLR